MTALDEAVESALSKKEAPSEALERAAQVWREITARLGLEAQRRAYQRSLGLEPEGTTIQ